VTTQNKAVTCYLPKDIEEFITGYCNEYGITRKDKEGHIYPSLGTGIIELLKLLAFNPELVSSPILDTVPSKFSEDAIEKKIEGILEKKLSHLPDNVPSIEVLKDRLDNWVLAVDGDIKDINQKIRDRSLQVDHQIASIKSRLDILEPLLKLQREASIADHSPIPTIEEPSPIPPLARPAIETVTPEVSPSPPGTDAIASIDGTVETVNTSPATPLAPDAIETSPIETSDKVARAIDSSAKGLTDSELARQLGIDKSNITRWKQKGHPTPKYQNQWELRGRLWYKKD
jgi:hypothetical protein